MESSDSQTKRSVLIVDRSADSREVLRTALSRRGVQILEATGPRQGLELCRQHHPEVVVLDLDCSATGDELAPEAFEPLVEETSRSLVVLGTVRRHDSPPPGGHFVPKPYHYAPLVRTIEQLLQRNAAAES